MKEFLQTRWRSIRDAAEQRKRLRVPAHCDGCDVLFIPLLTEARCPVCAEKVSGLEGVVLQNRFGRPFALRFAWLAGLAAFLLLAHALYG
jgi:hypothetical protein